MALFKPRKRIAQTIAEVIHDHMRGINECFPGETKLTLVIRAERFEKPLIFTNDTADAAVRAIREMTEGSPNLIGEGSSVFRPN